MIPSDYCSDCSKPLAKNPRRKGTRCQPCTAKQMVKCPARGEKIREAMRAHWADDAFRNRQQELMRAGIKAAEARPEYRESKRAQGRRVGSLGRGQNRFPAGSPERKAAGRKNAETKLKWCPPGYRSEYQQLRDKIGNARDARAATLNMIQKDARMMARGLLGQREFMRVREALRYLAGLMDVPGEGRGGRLQDCA